MRNAMKLSIAALSLVAGLAACRGGKSKSAAKQADFNADLQLASSTTMNLAAPKVDPALLTLENQPQNAPQPATVVKKGAGNRAVHSASPTVHADLSDDVAAVDENTEETETVESAPAPENNEPVAVAPRPAPTPVVLPAGNGSGDYGTSGSGGGIFGPGGGIGGVIIRGGGVDGDHCEIHGRRGGTRSGPVYVPNTGGISIGSRFPGGISGGGVGTRRVETSSPRPGPIVVRRGR